MIQHEVPCCDCGTILLRKTHYRSPRSRCDRCHRRLSNQRQVVIIKHNRTEARRYRIILHILGWDDSQFHEMIREMKQSPMSFRKRPEGMMPKRDFFREGLKKAGT